MRGIDALCECRDKRERAGVLRNSRVRSGGRAGVMGGGAPLVEDLWAARQDVWSGRSAASAAPPRPPLSRSRTRGRPRWGWTLSPRGAHTSHLCVGGG